MRPQILKKKKKMLLVSSRITFSSRSKTILSYTVIRNRWMSEGGGVGVDTPSVPLPQGVRTTSKDYGLFRFTWKKSFLTQTQETVHTIGGFSSRISDQKRSEENLEIILTSPEVSLQTVFVNFRLWSVSTDPVPYYLPNCRLSDFSDPSISDLYLYVFRYTESFIGRIWLL